MSNQLRMAAGILLLSTLAPDANTQVTAPNRPLPPQIEEADITKIPMGALTHGQTSVTLAIAAEPLATLQDRINHTHLKLNILGWKFVGQEFVTGDTGKNVVLLSYQH